MSDTCNILKGRNSVPPGRDYYLYEMVSGRSLAFDQATFVKRIQYSVVKQKTILFTSCVNISEQYLGYYAKYCLFNLKGSKSKVTVIGILGSSLCFIEAVLIHLSC